MQESAADNFPKIINVSTTDTGETYLKAFLIDDSINKNFWQIPENALKKYATSFIGKPFIMHPSGDHPNYIEEGIKEASPTFVQDILAHQEQYKVGDIVDVQHESVCPKNPNKKAYYAYIKLTNPQFMDTVKQGASSFYVSPQIFDLDQKPPGEPTTNFLPLHLAVVKEPAYGDVAKIKAACNGAGGSCLSALKKAALDLVNQIDRNSYYQNSGANGQLYNNLSYKQNNNQEQGLDPNYPQDTNGLSQLAQTVSQPQQLFTYNSSTQTYEPITTSKTTTTKKVDAQGNLITETQDFKPKRGQAANPQQQQQQGQSNNIVGQQPPNNIPRTTQIGSNVIPNNQAAVDQQQQSNTTIDTQSPKPNTDAQVNATANLPEDILNRLKEIDSLKQEFDDLKKFKQTQEEKQLLEASEAQRQTIDAAFSPLFPDENERQQVVDFFVSLNVSDDQLGKLLDFVTKGVMNTDQNQNQQNPNAPPNQKQAAPAVKATTRKVKGAALVMSNNHPTIIYDEQGRRRTASNFQNGILGDVNWENLL